MSMSNAAENALLQLLFLNADWAGIGDAGGLRGSVSAGNYYVSLHTADPGEAGTQATNEATFVGYARVAIPRGGLSGVNWTVLANQVANAASVQFAECTGGTETLTHFAFGQDASGAGQILVSGALGAPRNVSSGITPFFNAGALVGTMD